MNILYDISTRGMDGVLLQLRLGLWCIQLLVAGVCCVCH